MGLECIPENCLSLYSEDKNYTYLLIARGVQMTLVITTLFATIDVAVKSNCCYKGT